MTETPNSKFFKFILFMILILQPSLGIGEEKYLKIGIMSCLTGDCAEWGINTRKGVELAIDQLNSQGGVFGRKIEANFEDSQDSTPSHTLSAYQKLSSDKEIKFIIGPTWTIGGMPVAPLIARNNKQIVVSPSVGVKEFNESSDNIFNTWPHDEKATRALARYALKKGWKTAAITGSQDPWVLTQSKVFREEYTSLGGVVKSQVDPLPGTRELRSEVLKIKNSNPSVVFISNYQADIIAKELSVLNFTAPKLAILMEKERVKSARGALENTVFALYEKPNAEFSKAFFDKFKSDPGITADTGYDALMIIIEGIKKSGSFELDKVKNGMHKIKDFKGASGIFSVDEKGAVDKSPVLWTVKSEDYVKVTDSN